MKSIIDFLSLALTWVSTKLKSENSTVGVKETKELVIGINEISLVVVKLLKDGLQVEDASAFFEELTKNEDLKFKIAQAYEGYKLIPREALDIDLGEGADIAKVQLEYLPKYLAEFKK